MFLIPLAITIGDFSLFAPGNVSLLLSGATLMTLLTYGLFRWSRNTTRDPFQIDEDETDKISNLKAKQPTDDVPIE